ncbi:hypothetical protein BVY00_02270 [bacterium G20]|nr:hypothetical protein BVY00_02270 [bacterium G20]
MPPYKMIHENVVYPAGEPESPLPNFRNELWGGENYPSDDEIDDAQQKCLMFCGIALMIRIELVSKTGLRGGKFVRRDRLYIQELTEKRIAPYIIRRQWTTIEGFNVTEDKEFLQLDPSILDNS